MSRFVKNMGYYFVGTFSTKLLQLLFIPLYTKYLSTAELGEFSVITVTVALCLPLLFQSIWEGSFRFAIEAKDGAREVLATCSKYCIAAMLFYSAFYVVSLFIFDLKYAGYILIYAIGQIIAQYWQFSARALKENALYSYSSVLNSVVTIALNFLLLIWFNKGVESLLIANTVGTLLMVALLEWRLKLFKDVFKFQFNYKLLLNVLKYSVPLAINSISWWLFSSSNNYIITAFLGLEETGLYNMAIKFGSILTTITSIITLAWNEEAFRSFEEEDQYIQFNKVLNLLIRSLLSLTIILIPFTYIAYHFFVFGEFKQSVGLITPIYLGAVFNAFACHLGSIFLARKESGNMFYTTLVGGITALVFSLLLVNVIGVIGACIASFIGYLLNFIIRIPLMKSRIKMELNYNWLVSLTAAVVLVGIICEQKWQNLYTLILTTLLCVILSVMINKEFVNILYKRFLSRLSH